jgi:predicted phage-related endonuclease
MTPLSREEWLAERRNHIGASDAWKILLGRKLEVYEAKVTGYSREDNDWLKFGRDVEGAIANMYEAKTDRFVEDLGACEIFHHGEISFLGATLDRITWKRGESELIEEHRAPLELKNVGDYSSAKAYQEDPDIRHQIQLQIQMACMGAQWGSLAALFPGYNLVWKDFERNDDFLEAIYPELENFWRCVVDKTPPPVESHRDLEVVKRLYPADSGETVALGNDEYCLMIDWAGAKEAKKKLESTVAELEAKLRAAIGDATWGALPDGTFLALKTVSVKGYEKVVEPYEYRTLRRVKVKK